MTDEEYLNMFIKEAKKAYKTIDNKAYNFPITINTAYRLAVSIEKCLKNQPDIVRCENCRHTLPKGFCHKHSRKVTDDWFCADGEPKESGEENE